jgi:hypothetical protein
VEDEELTEVVVEKDSAGLVSFSFRRPLQGKDLVGNIQGTYRQLSAYDHHHTLT